MTSVPGYIGKFFNTAHAQCLAVAFLNRFSVDGRKRRENECGRETFLLH